MIPNKSFYHSIEAAVISASLSAFIGSLLGFTYAKFANLPAGKVAKTIAIWHAIEAACLNLTSSIGKDTFQRGLLRAAVIASSAYLGSLYVYKECLLGKKMLIAVNVIRIVAIANLLLQIKNPSFPEYPPPSS